MRDRADWKSKVSELHARAFCQKWMRDMPPVDPVRLFFVPFPTRTFGVETVSIDAGIVFDRCRISALSHNVEEALIGACAAWSRAVIKARLRG